MSKRAFGTGGGRSIIQSRSRWQGVLLPASSWISLTAVAQLVLGRDHHDRSEQEERRTRRMPRLGDVRPRRRMVPGGGVMACGSRMRCAARRRGGEISWGCEAAGRWVARLYGCGARLWLCPLRLRAFWVLRGSHVVPLT